MASYVEYPGLATGLMHLPRDPRSFDGRARSEQRRNIDGLQVHPDTLSARKSAYNQLCLADLGLSATRSACLGKLRRTRKHLRTTETTTEESTTCCWFSGRIRIAMFFRRTLFEGLVSPTSQNKVCLLFGARQTGKTALLRQVLKHDDEAKHYDLQNSDLRRQFERDPGQFSREIRALSKKQRVVVVDEIQKVPSLLEEVQSLHDTSPKRWQFYLTGSSARRLRTGSANLLPGRSHTFHLHPVCRWEEQSKALTVPVSPSRLPKGIRLPPPFAEQELQRRLLYGSLPGIRAETNATAAATLDAYVANYVEEEVRREAVVRDLGPFMVFLRLAALESGQVINLAALSQESGVPASTLKNYYQVLVDTFLGHWMPAYGHPSRKRVLTTPRFYLFDLGVRHAAAELPANRDLLKTQGGPLLEHWVAQELIARASYAGRGHRVTFWRTVDGVEVDFIYETPRGDLPIEVKWTERPRREDARHLELFLDKFADRSKRGVLVCRCERPQQLTDRVTAIPWSHL